MKKIIKYTLFMVGLAVFSNSYANKSGVTEEKAMLTITNISPTKDLFLQSLSFLYQRLLGKEYILGTGATVNIEKIFHVVEPSCVAGETVQSGVVAIRDLSTGKIYFLEMIIAQSEQNKYIDFRSFIYPENATQKNEGTALGNQFFSGVDVTQISLYSIDLNLMIDDLRQSSINFSFQ